MERTKKTKIADAILTADLHLTAKIPISRTDDYVKAQENKLRFLSDLSQEHNCPILCAGDIFDHWNAGPGLCSWAFHNLPGGIVAIPGNHDLPLHSLTHYEKSALYLLEAVGKITVLKGDQINIGCLRIIGIPYGVKNLHLIEGRRTNQRRRILLLHELVIQNTESPIPGGYTAAKILEMYGKDFDLIVTGDNHQSFTVKTKKSLLVNPGSMMRITADQADFRPRCYLYYAEDNSVVPVEFPIQKEVHNRDHLIGKKEREERIAAYIERMKTDWDVGVSFRGNLEAFFKENSVPRKVREIIWQHLESI